MATTRHGHGLGVLYDVGPSLMAETCPELFEWQGRRIAELTVKYGPERARLFGGHWDVTIFPNASFVRGAIDTFKQWIPRGPDSIEVLTWAFAEKSLPDDLKLRIATASHRMFGTAGLFESDDGDAMEYCAQQNKGRATRETTVDSSMGRGTEREDPIFPGVVGEYMNELAQRGFYRYYAECMASDDWETMRGNDGSWKNALLGR
jgi:3-phenylpropionate/trans-cinnamate dioxygenase alpha subunit